MSKILWFMFFLLFIFFLVFFQLDLNIGTSNYIDNNDELDRGSKMSIQKAINRGTLRVEEEIEVDKTVVTKELEKHYKITESVTKSRQKVVDVQEKPAMISVQAMAETNSYSQNYFGEKKNNMTSQRYIVIYEAKNSQKRLGGNVD